GVFNCTGRSTPDSCARRVSASSRRAPRFGPSSATIWSKASIHSEISSRSGCSKANLGFACMLLVLHPLTCSRYTPQTIGFIRLSGFHPVEGQIAVIAVIAVIARDPRLRRDRSERQTYHGGAETRRNIG